MREDTTKKSFLKRIYDTVQKFGMFVLNWFRKLFGLNVTPVSPPQKPLTEKPKQIEARIEAEVEKRLQSKLREETEKRAQKLKEQRAKEQRLKEEREAELTKRKEAEQHQKREAKAEEKRIQALKKEEADRAQALKDEAEANLNALYKAISNKDLVAAAVCLKKMSTEAIQKIVPRLLYETISADHLEGLKLLLMTYGVALDTHCKENIYQGPMTLLKCAIEKRSHQIIQFLLEQKIKITEADVSAAYSARYLGRDKNNDIFNTLLNTNRLTFYPDNSQNQVAYFSLAIHKGHAETVKRSLQTLDPAKTKIYTLMPYSGYISFIDWAMGLGHEETARLLLSFYLDHEQTIQNHQDVKQYYFYCAVKHGCEEIIQILLSPTHIQDIDINQDVPDKDAIIKDHIPSALYYAIEAREHTLSGVKENPKSVRLQKKLEGIDKIINLLLELGADFGSKSYYTHQIKIIENSKIYITPLYDKALKEGLPDMLTDLRSIIVEYAMPGYVLEPEPKPKVSNSAP